MKPLPIDSLLPEVLEHLKRSSAVIIEAPPGSGKTTRVAPGLVEAGGRGMNGRVFLLQPRRVAARAAATRIADERGWSLGQEVGYQVRFESKCSATTPCIVATEGILLRRLTSDPVLTDVAAVILDEFHERSLNADLLLGMLRRVQQLVRPDLKLIVMSATIETESLQQFLDGPVLKASGTQYPVDVKYRPPGARQEIIDHVVKTVLQTAEQRPGDMLVFLPGVGEISRVLAALQRTDLSRSCDLRPLHGSLPLDQQNAVLRAGPRRRIVLATNVAETSLTLEGIRTVIDSGQARVLRFDPVVGLDRLQLEPICQSSAVQRAGRAGRLESGVCLRLWDEKSQRARPLHLDPEICRVDLAAAVLQLFQWGEQPDGDFPWLEPPRPESVAASVNLLEQLGAVKADKITELGQAMVRLPVSPRLARMLLESQDLGQLDEVAVVAAMLSERDPFLRPSAGSRSKRLTVPTRLNYRWDCDVSQRLLALQRFYTEGNARTEFGEIHRGAAHSIKRVAEQLIRAVTNRRLALRAAGDDTDVGLTVRRCLLAAFPDRVARRRSSGDAKGRMVGGRGVKLSPTSGVTEAEIFVCVDVDAGTSEALVRQASAVDPDWLPASRIDEREEQFFNPTRQQVEARRRRYYGDLMLAESPATISDETQCRRLLMSVAARDLRRVLPKDDSQLAGFVKRMECLRQWAPELGLPAGDDQLLLDVLRELCPGRRSLAELRSAPWLDWLKGRLTPEQRKLIDRECPERIEVPSGNRVRLEYLEDGKAPILAVRIQEIFSWRSTPRIAFGRIPILLHLLAPNMRPQQVTDDLASFWANTYQVVRKELRRRYPKHAWPEDPLTAEPERKHARSRPRRGT